MKEVLYRTVRSLGNKFKYNRFDMFNAVELETCTVCNLRCSYCPNSIYDRSLEINRKQMPMELFKRIIDQLSDLGFDGRISPHFYNEPLMDSRIVELIRYIYSKIPFSNVMLFTNGELLNLELYKTLVSAGVKGFVISMHKGHNPVMDEIIEYRKNSEDNVFFDYRKPFNLNNRGGLLDLPGMKGKRCHTPSDCITIDYAGNVVLCCNDYNSSITFGNLKDENILEIWDKRLFKNVRTLLKNGFYPYDICQKCKHSI